MKSKHLLGLLGALGALTLAFATVTRGENSPPAAPAADNGAAAPAAVEPAKPDVAAAPAAAETPPAAPVPPAADKAAPPPETPPAKPEAVTTPAAAQSPAPAAEAAKPSEAAPAPETPLRRLDTEMEQPSDVANRVHDQVKKAVERRVHAHRGDGSGERVNFGSDTTVGKDEKAETAVSILGSTTVDGEVADAAVSIMGTTTVNGSVGNAAVAVMGSTHVNGTVHGEVVAVGGDVELGPKAEVWGEVVSVGGSVHRDPGAVVHGNVQQVSFMKHFPKFDWLYAWIQSALFKGRLLSFASGAGWAWLVAGAVLLFYVLLALVFPRGIEKCAATLEEHPGYSILTAFLTMLAMPLIFVLLAITGIGLIVVPFLGIGLFGCRVFGRATMLAWLGRRFTVLFGEGPWAHAAVSVLVGGILVMMLYLVPILAFIVAMLIGFLGLGTVIYTLIRSMRRNGAKPAPAGAAALSAAGLPAMVPAAAPAAGGAGDAAAIAVPPVVAAVPSQLVISAATLPHAGFWIRMAALLVDVILWALLLKLMLFGHFGMSLFLLVLAAYGAVMWVFRGTTIGGSIFHLKVVRVDDRPIDWTVAIVRALSCFLSLVVVGVGFLWIAFDDGKQGWHDKIAGTVVVQVPKSVPLI